MSLFDLIASGVKVTNLDGTEADVAAIAEETKDEEVAVEQGAGEEPAAVEPEAAEGEAAPASEEAAETAAEASEEAPAAAEVPAETVVVEEDSAGDEVVIADADELNTALLEVQEEEAEYQDAEESIEEAEEAAVSTESLLKNLYAAKALGGMGIAHAELANEHVQFVGKSLGMTEAQLPAMAYSQESFSSAGAIALTTESAIQQVKDFFVNILNAILDGIAWLVDKAKTLWNKLFANYDRLGKYIASIKEAANAAKGKTAGKVKFGRHLLANLMVKGNVVSPSQAVVLLAGAVNEVADKWNARSVVEIGNKLAKDTDLKLKSAEAGAKANAAVGLLGMDVMANLPFGASQYEVSAAEAEKLGLKVAEGAVAHVSAVLPRNKFVGLVVGKSNVRAGVFSYSGAKDAPEEAELSVGVADILKDLDVLAKLVGKMSAVKEKLQQSATAAKGISAVISRVKTKYLALSKEARGGKSFMDNRREVSETVADLKNLLVLLREPATSFSGYFLNEAKGLADFYKAAVKSYSATKEEAAA